MRWAAMLELVDDKRYIGRCRDRHPFDCGHTQCGVCRKPRRRLDGVSQQEQASELVFLEYVCERN